MGWRLSLAVRIQLCERVRKRRPACPAGPVPPRRGRGPAQPCPTGDAPPAPSAPVTAASSSRALLRRWGPPGLPRDQAFSGRCHARRQQLTSPFGERGRHRAESSSHRLDIGAGEVMPAFALQQGEQGRGDGMGCHQEPPGIPTGRGASALCSAPPLHRLLCFSGRHFPRRKAQGRGLGWARRSLSWRQREPSKPGVAAQSGCRTAGRWRRQRGVRVRRRGGWAGAW